MTPDATYKVVRDDFGPTPSDGDAATGRGFGAPPSSIGLWAFMGVATSLFSLFIVAFALRMDSPDWHAVALPWQVWLSTALLIAGSAAMALASRAAQAGKLDRAIVAMTWGGVAAAGFVASQWWAWQALHGAAVLPANNPAAGFFYLLTGMHGLHVIGGLIGWGMARFGTRHELGAVMRVRLCARYWHFLLAVWLVLLAALGWLTPEIVRFICGTD
jgi:cytochrome c oxidase subunit 3